MTGRGRGGRSVRGGGTCIIVSVCMSAVYTCVYLFASACVYVSGGVCVCVCRCRCVRTQCEEAERGKQGSK